MGAPVPCYRQLNSKGVQTVVCGRLLGLLICAVFGASALGAAPALAKASYGIGLIREVSAAMPGQNAEVEQATDPAGGYVYEEWIGQNWIGFARSTDGGAHFGKPVKLPGSAGGWDPALAVASDGTVYAAFMVAKALHTYPVVVASFDHGQSFPQLTALKPKRKGNWGDRDFIATGPNHTVYVTWDYGPYNGAVKLACASGGSCSFTRGDLNVVMQVSTDGGKSFGPINHISPGFPASGADSAPLVVEPGGRIDVLYQGYHVTNRRTFALGRANSYFTSSTDGGNSWSSPVKVGAAAGTMSAIEWWIDGAIGADAGGNLYATWDTQSRRHDTGWLSYSTDHGARWSAPIRVGPGRAKVPRIVQVAGGPAGIAYVGWLTERRPYGYAQFLRTFSIANGWLSGPRRISRRYGAAHVWPGDTFGLSTLSLNELVLSWGSAVRGTGGASEIFAVPVTAGLP